MPAPRGIPWIELAARGPASQALLVDTRPRTFAQAGHLPGSAWLPVPDPASPAAALPSFLLPPPRAELVVVADDPAASHVIAAHLCSRGYDATYLGEPFPTADRARAAGVTLATGLPTGHLWQPDPLLREHLHLLPPPGAGPGAHLGAHPIADLGCGSGRDAVFLALRGYDVVAVDRLPDALQLTQRRAQHHAVAVRTLQADPRRPADLEAICAAGSRAAAPLAAGSLGPGPFAAVLLIRVHHPDALRALPRLLAPGGLAVIHGFVRQARADDARERRPKAALSLAQLNATFAGPDWEVLLALDPSPEADRALAARIARRRA